MSRARRSECWICEAGQHERQGYHLIKVKGGRVRAHRLAYALFCGPIPASMVVRHSCHNPECVNPAHLLIGTRKDNTRDMLRCGRASDWSDRPNRRRRKLSRQAIREIRRSKESSYQLAERYPVTAVQIRRIRNGSRCAGL
jgi:hypothetical protein